MITYHTGIEADIIALETQYTLLLGLPNQSGTVRWAIPQKAIDQDLWFIPRLPENGWGNADQIFTSAEIMPQLNLTNITDMPFDENWFPPASVFGGE